MFFLWFLTKWQKKHTPKKCQEWNLLGNSKNFKVRMSNVISENTAVLIQLVSRWRPSVLIVSEQPKGSWMFKACWWKRIIEDFQFQVTLTYMGLWGLDLLKGTHLCNNLPLILAQLKQSVFLMFKTFQGRSIFWDLFGLFLGEAYECNRSQTISRKARQHLARKATKTIKAKFDARIARKKQRALKSGKAAKEYYSVGQSSSGRKTFSGGRDLQSTAAYPQRFCTALYHAWCMAQGHQRLA